MGMYDTVMVDKNKPIKCPKCKKEITELQTKDLNRLLDVFVEGKTERKVEHLRPAKKSEKGKSGWPFVVPDGTHHFEPHPRYMTIYAYDYCNVCQDMVGQNFRFDTKGNLKRYGKPRLESTIGELEC